MSDKPGRNDPCYCGSGKKYKKCHLPTDQAAEREQRDWKEAARFLRQDILDYAAEKAEEEEIAAAFANALSHFWNDLYTVENAEEMAQDESRIFFDWFAFDYELDDGRRVLDLYREEVWEDLSGPQQQTLERWLEAEPLSGHVLQDYEGQTLYVRELLSGEKHEVFEPAGHGDMEEGDILLARLVPIQDRLEFSTDIPYIPGEEAGDAPEKLAAAWEQYREENPDATRADFLRRHNTILIHHALEAAEKAGRPPVARLDPKRPDKAPPRLMPRFSRR